MTGEEVQAALDSMKFPPDMQARLGSAHGFCDVGFDGPIERYCLEIGYKVSADIRDGELIPMKVNWYHKLLRSDDLTTITELIVMLRNIWIECQSHEFDEWMSVDGQFVFNPHPEGGSFRRDELWKDPNPKVIDS